VNRHASGFFSSSLNGRHLNFSKSKLFFFSRASEIIPPIIGVNLNPCLRNWIESVLVYYYFKSVQNWKKKKKWIPWTSTCNYNSFFIWNSINI